MTSVGTFGWESLAPEGRRLTDETGEYHVSVKRRTNGATEGFLYLKIKGRDGGWTHIVLDAKHNVVAQGFGALEKDSWAMTETILKAKGYLAN
jgi:hypothetical protein